MNQILEYSPNKNSGGRSSNSDKIVRVFAVFLILFAICLIAVGGYGYFVKNADKDTETPKVSKAQITVEQVDTEINIKIEHDKVIEEVIYNWDTEKEKTVKGEGKSTMEFSIPIIVGQHTLNIKVIDSDQNETIYTEEISSDVGEDKMNPTIDLEIIVAENDEGKKVRRLQITAKDETAIDFVTYRWNNEEEEKVEADDDEKVIEFNIDILKGQNDIVVVAVDKNKNKTTETETYIGSTKPEVRIIVAPDKKSAIVTCTHENGLKSPIIAKINDQEYEVEVEEGTTTAEFKLPLEEGTNKVSVTAISVDDTEATGEEEIVREPEAAPETQEPDEITIDIQKNDDSDTVLVSASCSAGIKEVRLNVNEMEYSVPLPEENLPGIEFDVPIDEGNSVITVTIISANGTEKSETKEVTR